MEVSPDGRTVAVSRDHEVLILDAGTLETIRSLPSGDDESTNAMAWLPDGSGLALGGDQGLISVPVRDGSVLVEPRRVFPGSVSEITVSPDGSTIAVLGGAGAVLGGAGAVVLIDIASGEPIGKPLKQGLDVGSHGLLQFSDDGDYLDVLGEYKRAYRYPIDTALLIARACRIAAREPTPAE